MNFKTLFLLVFISSSFSAASFANKDKNAPGARTFVPILTIFVRLAAQYVQNFHIQLPATNTSSAPSSSYQRLDSAIHGHNLLDLEEIFLSAQLAGVQAQAELLDTLLHILHTSSNFEDFIAVMEVASWRLRDQNEIFQLAAHLALEHVSNQPNQTQTSELDRLSELLENLLAFGMGSELQDILESLANTLRSLPMEEEESDEDTHRDRTFENLMEDPNFDIATVVPEGVFPGTCFDIALPTDRQEYDTPDDAQYGVGAFSHRHDRLNPFVFNVNTESYNTHQHAVPLVNLIERHPLTGEYVFAGRLDQLIQDYVGWVNAEYQRRLALKKARLLQDPNSTGPDELRIFRHLRLFNGQVTAESDEIELMYLLYRLPCGIRVLLIAPRFMGFRQPHPTLIGGNDPLVYAGGTFTMVEEIVQTENGPVTIRTFGQVRGDSGHFRPNHTALAPLLHIMTNLPATLFARTFAGFVNYNGSGMPAIMPPQVCVPLSIVADRLRQDHSTMYTNLGHLQSNLIHLEETFRTLVNGKKSLSKIMRRGRNILGDINPTSKKANTLRFVLNSYTVLFQAMQRLEITCPFSEDFLEFVCSLKGKPKAKLAALKMFLTAKHGPDLSIFIASLNNWVLKVLSNGPLRLQLSRNISFFGLSEEEVALVEEIADLRLQIQAMEKQVEILGARLQGTTPKKQ